MVRHRGCGLDSTPYIYHEVYKESMHCHDLDHSPSVLIDPVSKATPIPLHDVEGATPPGVDSSGNLLDPFDESFPDEDKS